MPSPIEALFVWTDLTDKPATSPFSRVITTATNCPDSRCWRPLPTALARTILSLPVHPLKTAPKDYWPADYWVTLGTSGLLTAITAVLLVRLRARHGMFTTPRCTRGPGLRTGHTGLRLRDARLRSPALRIRSYRLVLLALQAM